MRCIRKRKFSFFSLNEMNETVFPKDASVVVIGGGILGCSTLYHLAQSGIRDAILLERSQLTSGTTWHSAAQVRALRSSKNLTELIRYSFSFFDELEKETGQATGWMQTGSLSIATNQERWTHILRQQSLAKLFGVRAQSISVEEARERWPLMNEKDVIGAVWSPDDGRVSPSDLCAALVKGAKSRGARIFEETPVTGILTENQKIRGVITEKGEIRCDAVALCSGLWSRELASKAGVQIPVWPCEHFYLLTGEVEGIKGHIPTLSDHDSHLYLRDESGGLLVGCFEPMGKSIDPAKLGKDFAFQLLQEDWEHFEPMMLNAIHRVPALEHAEVKKLLNGPESFTVDGSFLLGESAETKGFFLGCGMNSVGVATGSGAGMALAHCIIHGRTPMDLPEADPKRFPDEMCSIQVLSERVPEVLGKHYEITFPGRQWKTSRGLRESPLASLWKQHHAHFGQFYGWERPLYFGAHDEPELTFNRPEWFEAVGKEVLQAHNQAALFDQSTLGKIRIEGRDCESFLQRVCTNRMNRSPGSVIYTPVLNETGTFETDLVALRLSDECFLIFVGTSSVKRDLAWFQRQLLPREQIYFSDVTESLATVALAGPESGRIASEVGASELHQLKYFQHTTTEIGGIPVRGMRVSFVGEAGWELIFEKGQAQKIAQTLLDAGAKPAGLFAQSSMRIEKRFAVIGHELDGDVSPLEAGMEFSIDWEKDFIGREALLERKGKGISETLVSIVLNDPLAVPLGNEPVWQDRVIIGKTTSASFGYRIGKPVALAFLDLNRDQAEGLDTVQVDIAGKLYTGKVIRKPAFDPSGQRMKV